MTRQLRVWYAEGPLLWNTSGNAWNRPALSCVFGRHQVQLGLRRMKELGVTLKPVKRFRMADFPDKVARVATWAEQDRRIYERRTRPHSGTECRTALPSRPVGPDGSGEPSYLACRSGSSTLIRLARRHGRKYTLYHLRHSWATRVLQRGVDPLRVAILMGHADPSMLAKVYAHLAQDPEYLQRAASFG